MKKTPNATVEVTTANNRHPIPWDKPISVLRHRSRVTAKRVYTLRSDGSVRRVYCRETGRCLSEYVLYHHRIDTDSIEMEKP